MKKILSFPLLFLLFQCTSPGDSTNQGKTDSLTVSDTAVARETQTYEASLNLLPPVEESSLEGLKLFSNSFKKEQPDENDKALKTYLNFQSKLIDELNNKIDRPDLEKLNTLFSGDSSKYLPEAVALEKEILKTGLRISQSEGTLYFDRNTKVIADYFLTSLSPSGKEFFTQFDLETNQPYSEDAGLSIPVKDLGERAVFWDKFLTSYPDHIFSVDARSRYEAYRGALLTGMDNTPAFDSESNRLSKEFLDAYEYIIGKYPDTKTGKMLIEYRKVLTANKNINNEKVKNFVEKNQVN